VNGKTGRTLPKKISGRTCLIFIEQTLLKISEPDPAQKISGTPSNPA
jgi:hypothetical protein